MTHSTLAPVTIDYPSSDGKPVAESDFQFTPLAYARDSLRLHFRDRSDVYVAGNLLIYYEEGNPKARVAPDVFVVLGVPNRDRSSYFLWEEREAPDFVLEITSHSTRREDQGRKRELYRRLGITEYWQYDPTGDYLDPPLQGLRLTGGAYRPMRLAESADGSMAMASRVLELELRLVGGELRFHDPVTNRNLLTLEEADDARRQAEEARRAAEARVAELEARLGQERQQ